MARQPLERVEVKPMNAKKANDAIETHEWPSDDSRKARPLCPQFRPCPMGTGASVGGHCLLSSSPRWLMMPTLDTYDRYCTRKGFAACDWFDVGNTLFNSGTAVYAASPIPAGGVRI